MTERTSGPDWELSRGVAKLIEAIHDIHTAGRSASTSMAASVMTLMMNRIEALETANRNLEARIAALEAERDAA